MSWLQYKGYLGSVEPRLDDNVLYGKLAFIQDLVTYEAETLAGLKAAFEASVDDYLTFCTSAKKTPNKPLKGSFNVRVGPELHRAAVMAAGQMSLNTFVAQAIEEKIAASA